MSRSSLDTDRFSALRSKGKHISTLPYRLSLSPRVFTKVVEAALVPQHRVVLGQPNSTSLSRVCLVDTELPGVFPAQESGSTETLSEAPGAYGIRSRCHAAWIASYKTASALVS